MKHAAMLLASLAFLTACSSEPAEIQDTEATPRDETSTAASATETPEPAAGEDNTGIAETPAAPEKRTSVPARFRGTFAPDTKACNDDYNYQPSFQAVDVREGEVMFFENGGKVKDVNVAGDSAAITYLDTYGDQQSLQVLYLALNADGSVRYRPGKDATVQTFVRCP